MHTIAGFVLQASIRCSAGYTIVGIGQSAELDGACIRPVVLWVHIRQRACAEFVIRQVEAIEAGRLKVEAIRIPGETYLSAAIRLARQEGRVK